MAPTFVSLWSGRFDAFRGSLCAAFAFAALYTLAVCSNGIPALRHDWWWPVSRYGFVDVFWNSVSGWTSNGIGAPFAYPGAYIIGTLTALAGFIFGPIGALALLAFAMGLFCTLGARHLALALNAAPLQVVAIELFAIVNPWIYNKTVAGHVYMILAFGALLALTGEMLAHNPRPLRMTFFLICTLEQLQFFLIAMVCAAAFGVLRRSFKPLVSGAIVALPLWIGLAMDRSNLLSTPYTLSWQLSQSVSPSKALVLSGYFARYASAVSGIQEPALWLLLVCVMVALVTTPRRAYAIGAAAAAAVFLAVAMGVRGPLAPVYPQIVTHVPESGLFRELYDLLGVAAIAYAVLLALGPRRRVFAAICLIASITLAAAWVFAPPSSFWINGASFPHPAFSAPANTRFALFPAFQPLSYEARGSGADRDTYMRRGNVSSLNQYQARYPADAALASFARDGRDEALRALSVSTIIERPWLRTDQRSLAYQMNLSRSLRPVRSFTVEHITPLPEMTIGDLPAPGSLVNRLGSGNELFSDARLGSLVAIKPGNDIVDESAGWSDVRFDFVAHPDLAQGIGGAVTTNNDALLPVIPQRMALINVAGTLRSSRGRVVAHNTGGYRWTRVPSGVTFLRCAGRCVVAAETSLTNLPPLNPPPRRFQGLEFTVFAPWFARVDLPAGRTQSLRYNVAYDPNWIALESRTILRHVRLDATVNGWVVPKRDRVTVVYIVHIAALLQTVGELIGILWILRLIAQAVRRRRPASSASTSP